MNKSVIATMLAAAVITGCGNDDKSSIDKEEVSLDLSSLTIDEAKEIMTSGKVTTADLMSAHYDRIEQYEPKYNAFISLSETALSEAEDIDQRRKKGDELGVLAGIPIVLKDSIDQKGVPTTAGWSGFSSKAGGIDLIPEKDAPLVKRLRDAGAIIVGKTNLPVFAASGDNANNSFNGPTGYDIFSDKGPLFYFSNIKDFQPNEYASPDLEAFNTLRSNYLEIFNNVMKDNQLDMLVFPQQRKPIGDRVTGGISATTVSEINLSGLPLVTLPAGKYSTGQPYAIAFVGPMWSEAKLLGYAYDMEDAVGPRPINRNLEK